MKKYKLKAKVFVTSIIGFFFSIGLFLLLDDLFSRLVLMLAAGLAIFNLINSSFTYYLLTDSELVLKGALKKIVINLDEIMFIGMQPAGKFVGESILVLSIDKRISITALTVEYWDLISYLIKALPDLDKVQIDLYVRNRVNQ